MAEGPLLPARAPAARRRLQPGRGFPLQPRGYLHRAGRLHLALPAALGALQVTILTLALAAATVYGGFHYLTDALVGCARLRDRAGRASRAAATTGATVGAAVGGDQGVGAFGRGGVDGPGGGSSGGRMAEPCDPLRVGAPRAPSASVAGFQRALDYPLPLIQRPNWSACRRSDLTPGPSWEWAASLSETGEGVPVPVVPESARVGITFPAPGRGRAARPGA